MTREKLWIIGQGSHAKMLAEVNRDIGRFEFGGFIDKNKLESSLDGLMGFFFPGVGINSERERIFSILKRRGLSVAIMQHPSACVADTVKIDDGVFVGLSATINHNSMIGRGSIVNTGSIVDHDTKIGDFSHICSGVITGGRVEIGDKAFIGMGSNIADGVILGGGCFIAMGSVVTKSFREAGIALGGTPAKPIVICEETRKRYQ